MVKTVNCLEDPALVARSAIDEEAGLGALKTERGCLPLVALDVRVRLLGLTAHTTVRQTFRNALDESLEATYIFPLPDRAAVTSFRMQVAGRVIEGELKERAQAREDYRQAIEAGHRAAIAEEERSGTFSLRVGNIPAKEEVAVELTLVGPVPVTAGEATFRFPLVVAPRYVPGIPLDGPAVGLGWGPDTDQVPDGSRVTPPVLLPGFPNPVRLALEVVLDPAGLSAMVADWSRLIRCSLHAVITDDGPPWTVRLQPGERLDRDFILRFPIATEAVESTLLCSPATPDKPGVFALTLVPPAIAADSRPAPRDVVIVLDRSGSMAGWKMVAARRAVGRMVDTLLEEDRFTILAFDNTADYPDHAKDKLVEATDRNRWQALEWLAKIEARGGTEMGPALQRATELVAAAAPPRRPILVLITDGQVAGEDVILRQLQATAGVNPPCIHAIGIDRAVNAGFLQRLADLAGGTCDLVESEDRLDVALDHAHRALATPVLTDLRLEASGFAWEPESLAPLANLGRRLGRTPALPGLPPEPARLPNLFADRPVTVFGRFTGEAAAARLRISGVDGLGRPWQQEVAASAAPADVLISLWGRARVRDLEDRYAAGTDDPEALARQIVEVSLASHVLSRFTAYVAVDRSEVVNPGGLQQQIVQPVELPSGWDQVPGTARAARSQVRYSLMACERITDSASSGMGGVFGAARRLLGGGGRSAPVPPPPHGRAERVAELREAIAQWDADPQEQTEIERLTRIVAWLEALAADLQQAGEGSARAVAELVRQGHEILDEGAAAKSSALEPTRLKAYFEAVEACLDSLSPGPKPARQRKPFWT